LKTVLDSAFKGTEGAIAGRDLRALCLESPVFWYFDPELYCSIILFSKCEYFFASVDSFVLLSGVN